MPHGSSSKRTTARVLGVLGAAGLLLLFTRVGWASEARWCRQVHRGNNMAAAIARGNGKSLTPGRHLKRPVVLDRRRGLLDLSHAALVAPPGRLRRESDAALRDRLSRMRDISMVERFRRAGLLIRVSAEAKTYYVAGVSASLRVVRPWTKYFIEQMSQAFHRQFDKRLRITSLTRTRTVQRRLLQSGIGAAPAHGPVQSTHLTGASVDVSKRALSTTQVAWLRTVLARLSRQGLVHVAEEFQEPHFHVMVTRRYQEYGKAHGPPDLGGGC